jgi:hypothetical protein
VQLHFVNQLNKIENEVMESNKISSVDLYNKSRARGDFQARFCERLAVIFRLPSRLLNVSVNQS